MGYKKRKEESVGEDKRIKLPKKDELIGILDQRLGGNKMMIDCSDGKSRNCRIIGKLRRRLWLRPKDVVLVRLWEFDKEKGDIILKYKPAQIQWLKRKGLLQEQKEEF